MPPTLLGPHFDNCTAYHSPDRTHTAACLHHTLLFSYDIHHTPSSSVKDAPMRGEDVTHLLSPVPFLGPHLRLRNWPIVGYSGILMWPRMHRWLAILCVLRRRHGRPTFVVRMHRQAVRQIAIHVRVWCLVSHQVTRRLRRILNRVVRRVAWPGYTQGAGRREVVVIGRAWSGGSTASSRIAQVVLEAPISGSILAGVMLDKAVDGGLDRHASGIVGKIMAER